MFIIHEDEKVNQATLNREISLLCLLENSGISVKNHLYRTYFMGRLLLKQASKHPTLKNEFDIDDLPTIAHSLLYHDIGKHHVKNSITESNGKLTHNQMQEMRKHVVIGERLLNEYYDKDRNSELFEYTVDVINHHHEKFDGTGYPMRISGSNIPLAARLMCVIDVFDALRENRAYNPDNTIDEALEYMQEQSGKSFDPDLVKLLMDNIKQVQSIFREHPINN